MFRRPILVSLCCAILAGLLLAPQCHAARRWGYVDRFTPDRWHLADPDYALCKSGTRQSPIDVSPTATADLPPLVLDYPKPGNVVINEGIDVRVRFPEGDVMVVDGNRYRLRQVHFHVPAENRLAGKSFPMEAHFLHLDEQGKLVVLAVLLEEGTPNDRFAALLDAVPAKPGQRRTLAKGFDPAAILPGSTDYATFMGSLTTPPCTEGVRWYVLTTPVQIGKRELAKHGRIVSHPTNRPLQPHNGREILGGK
ncbi:MAG: carbonic anhydrase family protein [Desulfovibrio sp.]|jgi:carbonic anhydrase|nr:carbonic anhydrase family protein [Desulfovibrio sp.]